MKLYRSRKYLNRWYAFHPENGWLMFPAEAGGWAKCQPARGFDPIDVREVPLALAAETGILTDDSHIDAPDSELQEAA